MNARQRGKPVKLVILPTEDGSTSSLILRGHGQQEELFSLAGVPLNVVMAYVCGNHPLAKIQFGELSGDETTLDPDTAESVRVYTESIRGGVTTDLELKDGGGGMLIATFPLKEDVCALASAIEDAYDAFEPPVSA